MALYGISQDGAEAMQNLANELCSSVDGLMVANRILKANITQYMDELGVYGTEIWELTLNIDGLLQDKADAIYSLAQQAQKKSAEILSLIGSFTGSGSSQNSGPETLFGHKDVERKASQTEKWNSEYMPLVKANIRKSVATHFSKYVSKVKLENCLNSLGFMDQEELRRRYESGGGKMPDGVLGFNDGNYSNIASDMKGTASDGRVGERFVPGSGSGISFSFVTAVHENLHMLSANDQPGEPRRGIMIGNQEESRAMNEAFTEYFTYISCGGEQPLGGLYPGVYSGYQVLMQEMPTIESAVGRDCMMDAYFNNNPQLLMDKIDSILGKGSWDEMCLASYDLMYNNNEKNGAGRLLQYLNRLKNQD